MEKILERDDTPMTAAERAFIERFTAEHCRPHREVMAARARAALRRRAEAALAADDDLRAVPLAAGAAGAASAARLKAPGEEVKFVFSAEAERGETPAWRAEVTVPPGADDATPVDVSVRFADGSPAADAAFKVAGRVLRIADGVSSMSFGDFARGLGDSEVALISPRTGESKGTLSFF